MRGKMNNKNKTYHTESIPPSPLYQRGGRGDFALLLCLFASLLLCFCFSCQPKASVATAHNKKLLDVIASTEKQSYETKEEQIMHLPPVHFPTDGDNILNEELGVLDDNTKYLEQNPHAVLVLEGHCDEWGSDKYNMELGDRRARRIKTHLIKKGIAADRLIMVVSYGARAPLDPRHIPNAWRANRRVEFIVR
jgi:outer membrane protein OmpA-like peptidoglycan-associated protein